MSSSLLDHPSPENNRRNSVVPVRFWTDYEPDPESPGNLREVDFVTWAKRGDLNSYANTEKIKRISKPLGSTTEDGLQEQNPVWLAIEPAYKAWKAGQDAPTDGTPLDAWSALSKAQATAFRSAGFTAVEHIADMQDSDLARVRLPDVRRLRDLAKAYVAHRNQHAPIEAAFASQAAELADMRAQLAEAMAALKTLGDTPASDEPVRRGPGRPRKEDV